MNVEISGRSKALDRRDRAAVGLVGLQLGLIEQDVRDGDVYDLHTDVTSLGCAASSRRSGIGGVTTHWRTGTRGVT